MRRLSLSCALLVFGFTAHSFAQDEPSFAELLRRLGDDDPGVREQAGAKLQKRGDVIIKDLEKAMVGKEPEVVARIQDILEKLRGDEAWALVGALDSTDRGERERVAGKLEALGRKAVPALLEALRHGSASRRMWASHLLDRIGKVESAIPTLIVALSDDNEHVRRNAANALGQMGPAAKAAIGPLMEAARRKDLDLRRNALRSLSRMGKDADAAFSLFIEALGDEDFLTRMTAIEGLARIGRPAKEVAPFLIQMLGDEDSSVPFRAVVALSDLGPTVVPFLADALRHKSAAVRRGAAESLGRFREIGKEAVSALALALKDEVPEVRVESAKTLRAMGPVAEEAAPALEHALLNGETAVHAAAALVKVKPQKKAELVPVLTALLESSDSYTRGIAARTLGEIGPSAKEAVPALRKLLKDKTQYFDPWKAPTVAGTAYSALWQITGEKHAVEEE